MRPLTSSSWLNHALPDGEQTQRLLAREPVVVGEELRAAHGPARHQPVQRRPGVVAADARAIGARADGDPHLAASCAPAARAAPLRGRSARRRYSPANAMRSWIAMPPPIALMRAQLLVAHRLGMIDRPARHEAALLALHPLEHVQDARDGLAVGRVLAQRPLVLHEDASRPRAGRLGVLPGCLRASRSGRAARKFSQSPAL